MPSKCASSATERRTAGPTRSRPECPADLIGLCTAGPETATRRRVDGRGELTGDLAPLATTGLSRVRNRDSIKKSLGIGVNGISQQRLGGTDLNHLAEVHHPDAVRHVAHHRQVMAHHDHGEPLCDLEVLHQVEQLCLDRHVKGRDGLVGHQQHWIEGQRPSETDALALSSGEFMRVALGGLRREAHLEQELEHTTPAFRW